MHSETLDPEHQRVRPTLSIPLHDCTNTLSRSEETSKSLSHPLTNKRTSSPSNDAHRALNFGEFVDGKAQQPLPKSLAAHEKELSCFADLCHSLCIKILRLFALGLEVSDHERC